MQVGPDQLPSLHALLQEAAAILNMPAPDLFVRQVIAHNSACHSCASHFDYRAFCNVRFHGCFWKILLVCSLPTLMVCQYNTTVC